MNKGLLPPTLCSCCILNLHFTALHMQCAVGESSQRGNQEACVLPFPEYVTHSGTLGPPPLVGLRGPIKNPKL